jgi:hypothetical protein
VARGSYGGGIADNGSKRQMLDLTSTDTIVASCKIMGGQGHCRFLRGF